VLRHLSLERLERRELLSVWPGIRKPWPRWEKVNAYTRSIQESPGGSAHREM
jgi:hypothetical protein